MAAKYQPQIMSPQIESNLIIMAKKLIIDTDTGVDDAMAILMALEAHKRCQKNCQVHDETKLIFQPENDGGVRIKC